MKILFKLMPPHAEPRARKWLTTSEMRNSDQILAKAIAGKKTP